MAYNGEIPFGIKPFDGTNFSYWCYRMKLFLELNEVHHVLEQEPPSDETELKVFKQEDVTARLIIVQGLADCMLPMVKYKSTAKEMFDALSSTYEKRGMKSLISQKTWRNSKKEEPYDVSIEHSPCLEPLVQESLDIVTNPVEVVKCSSPDKCVPDWQDNGKFLDSDCATNYENVDLVIKDNLSGDQNEGNSKDNNPDIAECNSRTSAQFLQDNCDTKLSISISGILADDESLKQDEITMPKVSCVVSEDLKQDWIDGTNDTPLSTLEEFQYSDKITLEVVDAPLDLMIENIYAPVARMMSLQELLSTAVEKGLSVHQLDVHSDEVFKCSEKGDLKLPVNIKSPEDYKSESVSFKIKKPYVYGLKYSHKIWNDHLNDMLLEFVFCRYNVDPYLYFKYKYKFKFKYKYKFMLG